jgi:amino acid permease
MRLYLWQRFLLLGWIGRLAAILVALYGIGWVFGKLGADSIAEQFGTMAKYVLSFLLVALLFVLIWRLARKPG